MFFLLLFCVVKYCIAGYYFEFSCLHYSSNLFHKGFFPFENLEIQDSGSNVKSNAQDCIFMCLQFAIRPNSQFYWDSFFIGLFANHKIPVTKRRREIRKIHDALIAKVCYIVASFLKVNDSSDILNWRKQWHFGSKEVKCEMPEEKWLLLQRLLLLWLLIATTQRGASRKLWVSTWSCEVTLLGWPKIYVAKHIVSARNL